ncbi:MAG: hypothetical protein ACI4P3_05190 [Candidatus Spyradosoma sp.]
MRKALLVLASLAAVAFAGCASSSSNPWATPDSKPVPKANTSAPASAANDTPSDALFADDAEFSSLETPSATEEPSERFSDDLLAEFPAIRKANLEKALAALKAASAVEELPMPDKGNARITRFNAQVGVIEFLTPNTYAAGDHVVLTKENKAALVTVIEVDGNRYVADVKAGVKGAPELKAADHVLCDIYRTPEELEKIAAEQRKAAREALAAARAAAQQEREALGEDEDEAAADEGGDEEEAAEEEGGDSEEEASEDEDW